MKQSLLDNKKVFSINSYLYDKEEKNSLYRFQFNKALAYEGIHLHHTGAMLNSCEVKALLKEHPECKSKLVPIYGGNEIVNKVANTFHRYAIVFEHFTEEEYASYPYLSNRIKDKLSYAQNVRSYKARQKEFLFKNYLVSTKTSMQPIFSFMDASYLYNHLNNIFYTDSYSYFAYLQSRLYFIWTNYYCTNLGHAIRYTLRDGFYSLHFFDSIHFQNNEQLRVLGKHIYNKRQEYLLSNQITLNDCYANLLNSNKIDSETVNLREVHDKIDRYLLFLFGYKGPYLSYGKEWKCTRFEAAILEFLYEQNQLQGKNSC